MRRSYGTSGPLENDMTEPYYQVAEVTTFYIGFHQPSVPRPVDRISPPACARSRTPTGSPGEGRPPTP